MNAARAITCAMRAQRRRDLQRLLDDGSARNYNVMRAWLMWGWAIHGPLSRSLGVPGWSYPYLTEPLRR